MNEYMNMKWYNCNIGQKSLRNIGLLMSQTAVHYSTRT